LVDELTDAARARLDFYEGGFGYALKPVSVQIEDETQLISAEGYFPAPDRWPLGGPWSLADWASEWAEITVEAAKEVMAGFGQRAPEDSAKNFDMIRLRAASRVRARAEQTPTALRTDFGAGDVAVSDHRRPYSGFFALEEQTLSFRRYAGDMSDAVHRSAFIGGDAVIVLPYDPSRDRVMVIEQFRMGPHMRGDPYPWQLEPIAGRIDAGEAPEDSAHREAAEEAGLTIRSLLPISNHYPSPGADTEYFYCFLGLCDLPDEAAGLGGVTDEAEDIRSHVIAFDQLMDLVATGEAACGPLVLCALWLSLKRDALRKSS